MDPRLIAQLLIIGVTFFMLINASAVLVLAERKIMGFMQQRYGPYLVGPHGMLQPLADIVKLLFKEELRPKGADKWLFTLAPMLSVTAAFAAFATVPWGEATTLFGLLQEPVKLGVADVNVGVLVVFAITSMGVYGIVLAGWSSNSKYSLLGGLRSSAQMISYELSYGTALAAVLLLGQSMSLRDIVNAQQDYWNVIPQFLAFLVWVPAALAVTHRTPFDLPEAESELVQGYHTEYSGMKFGMFMVSEYVGIVMVSALTVTMFFGGWHGPGSDSVPLLGLFWFCAKTFIFMASYILVRASLPRPRYDQIMSAGWKFCLPVSLVNMLLTGAVVLWKAGV